MLFAPLLWANFLPAHVFPLSQYYELAQRHACFQTVCRVHIGQHGIMTGVLVQPNMVITAAHGVGASGKKWVEFPDGTRRAITDVRIDPGYSKQRKDALYDMAICTLAEPIVHIQPAPLFRKAHIPPQALLLSGTIANGRLAAYQLCEFSKIYPGTDENHHLYGSLFPHPDGPSENQNIFLPELEQRAASARYNWRKHNCLPYGLAKPGASGSPVFVCLQGKMYLFGLVIMVMGPEKPDRDDRAYNRYQTVMTLFYEEKGEDRFHLQARFSSLR